MKISKKQNRRSKTAIAGANQSLRSRRLKLESLECRDLLTTFNATDFASLVTAINSANSAAGDDIVSIDADIRLTAALPKIDSNIAFQGNSHFVSGDANNSGTNNAGDVRVFFVNSGTVSFADMTIKNGRAQGGNGGTGIWGGGGGLGAGGGLFVNAGTVGLSNVTFSDNAAVGGNGGAGTNAKGGGGGGGGLGGNGGNAVTTGSSGLGGAGGEGGGFSANGNNAVTSGNTQTGGSGGSTEGGNGGNGNVFGAGSPGAAGTDFGGGGGGGSGSGSGGAGAGASGGYGAGSGGGALGGKTNSASGNAGFGGGSGGGATAGTAGTNGGTGVGGGGGGGGMGGAFFIRAGTLSLSTVSFTNNGATGGAGGAGGSFSNGNPGQGRGGAGYVDAGAAIIPTAVSFSANSSSDGGAGDNIQPGPVLSTQPTDRSYTVGASVTFTAAATPTNCTAQWQLSTDGGTTFSDIVGATSVANVSGTSQSTYTFTGQAANNGQKFRCVFTNTAGISSISNSASALQSVAPTVSTNPQSQTKTNGQSVTFTAAATGNPTPTVQWQLSTNGGGSFSNISGATSTSYTFTVATTDNTKQYRAVFTNSVSTANTTAATLSVPPNVTTQPATQTKTAGQSVSFTAAAAATPAATVKWQVSINSGANFSDIAGATSTTYTFTTAAGDNGKQFRAVFTNSGGSANSDAATLTVNAPPSITTNPTSQIKVDGQSVSFTAAASGTPAPTVKWQVSINGGANFSDITGATSTSYTFTVATTDNQNRYRAVFTNAGGSVNSNAATLSVPPNLTTQPADQTKTAGETVSFTAAASATPAATVQWQVSTDSGANFSNIAGATSTTYTFTTAAADNGKQFRAVFTNSGGSTNSSAAALTVNKATVGGTATLNWGVSGTAVLQTNSDGLRLLPTGRNNSLPWLNVSKIQITLDAPASLSASDISVSGITVANYGPVSLSGSGTNYTITFAQAITAADRVTISIGNANINTFTRRLDVLPGDINDDATVNSQDAVGVRNQMPGYGTPPTIFGDLNGDGVIDITDYNETRRRANTSLPRLSV